MKTNEFDTDRIRIFISPYTIIIIKLIVKFYNNNTDCSFNRILANFQLLGVLQKTFWGKQGQIQLVPENETSFKAVTQRN